MKYSVHNVPTFALENPIKKEEENQEELELNGTHQFLISATADDKISDSNLRGTTKINKRLFTLFRESVYK
jgi:hypothetical protein